MGTAGLDSDAAERRGVPQDDLAAIPARYWWLRRILIGVGALLLAVVGLRIGWGVYAEHRLQDALHKAIAAGEPLYPQDFARPRVPDDDNAVVFYNRAVEAIVGPSGKPIAVSEAGVAVCFGPPDPIYDARTNHPEQWAQLAMQNGEALRWVRRARAARYAEWAGPVDDYFGFPSTGVSDPGRLADLLWIACVAQHEAGDDAGAVEHVRDLLHLADTLAALRSFGYCLDALRVVGDAAEAVERIAPALRVAGTGATQPAAGQVVSRAQVRALVDALLDETTLREGCRWGTCQARTIELEWVERCCGAPLLPPRRIAPSEDWDRDWRDWVLRCLFKPGWQLRAADCVGFASRVGAALDGPRAIEAAFGEAELPERMLGEEAQSRSWLSRLHEYADADMGRIFPNWALALRRLAVGRLALRLYELDRGSLPNKLAELVPDYLPVVPNDPFFTDGRPIGFRPDTSHAGLFAGEPEANDARAGGDGTSAPIASDGRPVSMSLDGWIPPRGLFDAGTPPASSQAVDDLDEVERQRQQADKDQPGDQRPE
jgi:hypothetical protein